jgi:hypothetical protein
MLRQEDCKFDNSLGNVARHIFKIFLVVLEFELTASCLPGKPSLVILEIVLLFAQVGLQSSYFTLSTITGMTEACHHASPAFFPPRWSLTNFLAWACLELQSSRSQHPPPPPQKKLVLSVMTYQCPATIFFLKSAQ